MIWCLHQIFRALILCSFVICFRKLQLLSKLYLDTAEGLWNGNKLKGKDAIIKFFEDLPTSEHKLESLDAQPLSGKDMGSWSMKMYSHEQPDIE